MISDLLFGATILIGAAGVVLLIDLARVGTVGFGSVADPDRQQLVIGLAMVAFAALFFLGRGVGGGGSPEPVAADEQPARAQPGDDASPAGLGVAARLPALRPRERPPAPTTEKPPPPEPEPPQPPPGAEDPAVSPPPPEDVEPAVEPVEPAVEPAPAPAPAPQPAPAPEPDPAPDPDPEPPVPFDDSG